MWTRGESRDEGPPVRKEQLNSKFLEKTITHTSSYTALVFSDHSVVPHRSCFERYQKKSMLTLCVKLPYCRQKTKDDSSSEILRFGAKQ